MSSALRAISRVATAAAKRSSSVQAAHAQVVPAGQQLAHTQFRTMASKSDKDKDEPEKLSGPLAKLMSIYEHFKGQIVEDNVHYEKAKPYQAPRDKRREKVERAAREIEADDKSSGVVVHEASRIEQQWKSFKESNAIANGLFNLRERYDESDNVVVRKARDVADSLSGVLSSLMESQDHSAVLTEIRRLDPTFDTLNFTVHLQHKVIPAVLEAFSDGDIETLRGWCTEACSIHLENVINSRKEAGLFYESRILDLDNVEFLQTTLMDEGPALIFTFQTQQTKCVRDRTGKVVEGGEDYIETAFWVFAMRRDPTILDPLLAWQVMEIGEIQTQKMMF